MDEVKVSVVVPSYKRHKEILARAIDSLLAQSYANLEIVLVDENASPELLEYRKEIESFVNSADDERILYIQNERNLGSAGARNVGINAATGQYITFLDDDDIYLPNKVKNQIEFILKNNLDMCFTNIAIANKDNKIVDFREFRRIKDFSNEKLLQYHLTRKITPTNIYMVKKECLVNVGGFDTHGMGDELFLMTKLIESGIKIGYLDDTQVVLYREGQESLTVGENRLDAEKQVFNFIKKYYSRLTMRQRCYVRFRYNITKIVTYKRDKKLFNMLGCLVIAFFCDPISFFVEPIRMIKNINKTKGIEI